MPNPEGSRFNEVVIYHPIVDKFRTSDFGALVALDRNTSGRNPITGLAADMSARERMRWIKTEDSYNTMVRVLRKHKDGSPFAFCNIYKPTSKLVPYLEKMIGKAGLSSECSNIVEFNFDSVDVGLNYVKDTYDVTVATFREFFAQKGLPDDTVLFLASEGNEPMDESVLHMLGAVEIGMLNWDNPRLNTNKDHIFVITKDMFEEALMRPAGEAPGL